MTLIGLADQQSEVVATRIDTEPSLPLSGPVKCLQIPTDFTLNVSVATGLLKNDNGYFNMVRQLNDTFLDKYDVNALDGIEKYQYLDQPNGNASRIMQTVLAPKVYGDYHSNFDEFPPENCCKQRHETADADNYVDMTSPVTSEDGYCTMTRGSPRHKSEREVSGQRVEGADSTTVAKSATFKPANKVLLNLPVPLDLSALEVKSKSSNSEKMNETLGLKDAAETSEKTLTSTDLRAKSVKEDAEIVKPESAIEESSSTVSVPSISKDQDGIPRPNGNASRILQTVLAPKVYGDYHSNFDEFPPENCCKQRHETADADSYVDMTSPVTSEDGYCTMTRGSPRHKSESEVSGQRVEGADSTTVAKSATFKPANKVLLNLPVPLDLSALEVKSKSSNSEKMNETLGLKDAAETSEKTLTSTDLCAKSVKEDAEIVKPESAIEESSSTVSVPSVSKDQDGIPADLASLSVEGVERLLRSLNMACYINKFRNEQIDGEILMELDEEELISLKVLPFHVVKLMKVISGWRPSV